MSEHNTEDTVLLAPHSVSFLSGNYEAVDGVTGGIPVEGATQCDYSVLWMSQK